MGLIMINEFVKEAEQTEQKEKNKKTQQYYCIAKMSSEEANFGPLPSPINCNT